MPFGRMLLKDFQGRLGVGDGDSDWYQSGSRLDPGDWELQVTDDDDDEEDGDPRDEEEEDEGEDGEAAPMFVDDDDDDEEEDGNDGDPG